jgi:hypothetical protein
MAYQRLLSDSCPEIDLSEITVIDAEDETKIPPKRNQVRELSSMLERGVGVFLRNNKIYVRYHGQVTFRIEMNYIIPIDSDDQNAVIPPKDNRIYMEDLEEYPVYLEEVSDSDINQLANFWFSFVEHGLDQVLQAHQIQVPDRPTTPEPPFSPKHITTPQRPITPDLLSG